MPSMLDSNHNPECYATALDVLAAAAYAARPRPLVECYHEARQRIVELRAMTEGCHPGTWINSKATLDYQLVPRDSRHGWKQYAIQSIVGTRFEELSHNAQVQIRAQYPTFSDDVLQSYKWRERMADE